MLKANPVDVLRQLPEHIDRRETSRALTFDEVDRLMNAVPDEDRRLYYLFAVRCGLRWQEVRRLRWEDIDLAAGVIRLRPEGTKSRRADVVDLPGDLVEAVRVRKNGHTGDVFASEPRLRTWKRDLGRAGIPYEVDGKQADRKCLRKTFCTHLAMRGVDLWEAVRRMRHRDPRLTVNVYTELGLVGKGQ